MFPSWPARKMLLWSVLSRRRRSDSRQPKSKAGGRKTPKVFTKQRWHVSNQHCYAVCGRLLMLPKGCQREFCSAVARQLGIAFSAFMKWNLCMRLPQETLMNSKVLWQIFRGMNVSLMCGPPPLHSAAFPLSRCINHIHNESTMFFWDNFEAQSVLDYRKKRDPWGKWHASSCGSLFLSIYLSIYTSFPSLELALCRKMTWKYQTSCGVIPSCPLRKVIKCH